MIGDVKIVFVNTAVPVAPVFEDSFPRFRARGVEPVALVSQADYRTSSTKGAELPGIVHLPCPAFARKRTLLRHLFFALSVSRALRRESPDAVVFLTQPPLFHVHGSKWCRIQGVPYLLHVMDQYPEILSALGKISGKGRLFQRMRDGVKRSYRGAAGLVSLGPCMTRFLREHYGVEGERIREVPNWSHSSVQPLPREENEFLAERGWQSEFVVLYSGNLGAGHDIATIEGVLRGCEGLTGLRFVFIGGGKGYEQLETRWKGAAHVSFLPFQPKEKLGESLSAASLHWISLKEEFVGLMVPSKLYGCLASGRPILSIGPLDSTVAMTVREAGCGEAVANGDVDGAIQKILARRDSLELMEREAANASAWHREQNGAPAAAEHYCETVLGFLGKTKPFGERIGK